MWKCPMESKFANEWTLASFSLKPDAPVSQHFSKFDYGSEIRNSNEASDWLFSDTKSMVSGFESSELALEDLGVDVNWAGFFDLSPTSTSSDFSNSSLLSSPIFSSTPKRCCVHSHSSDSSPSTVTFQDTDTLALGNALSHIASAQSWPATQMLLPEVAWGNGRSKVSHLNHPVDASDNQASGVARNRENMPQIPRLPHGQIAPNLKPPQQCSQRPFELTTKRRKSASSEGSKHGISKRRTHNDVEREYRNRLNSHFTDLLSILPSEVLQASLGSDCVTIAEADKGEGKRVSAARKVCKGTVLELAMMHIRNLERENLRIEQKLKALGED